MTWSLKCTKIVAKKGEKKGKIKKKRWKGGDKAGAKGDCTLSVLWDKRSGGSSPQYLGGTPPWRAR